MLDVAGAPKLAEKVLTDYITMKTGDLWHDWMYESLDRTGWPYMRETRLSPWLPEGWRGRADLVVYHPEYQAFVLGDIKTTKGESMFWLDKTGAKESHIWQVSAYWHALVKMGLPMLEACLVFYWPKNGVRDQVVLPSIQEVKPLPVQTVKDEMTYRWERVSEYLRSIPEAAARVESLPAEAYLTDELEPVQEREQKLVKNSKTGGYDLRLVPSWDAKFCEFDVELCDCSTQGTTKIGQYDREGNYTPRKGYEEIVPDK